MKILILVLALLALPRGEAAAQRPAGATLAELIADARMHNPEIQVARRMADAAAARIPQAGALPDPVLSLGLMNLPVSELRLSGDDMAMAGVQIGQMLPAPGVRSTREAVARAAYQAAERQAEEVELAVLTRLKGAFYELFFTEQALEVLTRNRTLLVEFAEIARARYAVGSAPQPDVLRAQTEVTRLDEQLAGLHARRTVALSELNAILQRPASEPLTPTYPETVRLLALRAPGHATFTAAALGSELGEGLPSLAELQAAALEARPALRAQAHRVEQARAGVRLAERERFPEIEVMLGYGAQAGGISRVSAGVSLPLPVFARRKQRQMVVEASHELAATDLELQQMRSEVAAEIAARYAEVVQMRQQTLLLSDGVIPQARATVQSAAAAYQGGRVEFLSLLEAQAMLFQTEIELARQLADFGRSLAELERAAGRDLKLEQSP